MSNTSEKPRPAVAGIESARHALGTRGSGQPVAERPICRGQRKKTEPSPKSRPRNKLKAVKTALFRKNKALQSNLGGEKRQ